METPFLERLVTPGAKVTTDGPMGTALKALGLGAGEPPERWTLERPEAVAAVSRRYVDAGAEVVHTNTFGASPARLATFGLAEKAEQLNTAAVTLARQAARGRAYVVGSLGPAGLHTLGSEATRATYRQQAGYLARGGVDAMALETMVDLEEALLALEAVRSGAPGVPVTLSFAFVRRGDRWFTPVGGKSPTEAAERCAAAGADGIGANCCEGLSGFAEIARDFLANAHGLPVLLRPSAGIPEIGSGAWPDSPTAHGASAAALFALGARAIGCCCGATADHVAAIRRAADASR